MVVGSTVYSCRPTLCLLIFLLVTCSFSDGSSSTLVTSFFRFFCVLGKGKFDDAMQFTIATSIILEATFWSINAILAVIYKFDLFPNYKLHEQYPPNKIILECLKDVALGHFVIRPPLLYYGYPIFQKCGMSTELENVPPLKIIYLQIFFCMCVDDSLFYWSHRLLHHPKLYKYIHKQHHMFKYTIGVATEYCHPVEDFLGNTMSTIAGPLILGCHLSVFWLYLTLKLWQSIDAHSGYNFPFPFSPFSFIRSMDCAPAHDYHHSHNEGNFGGFFIFWDWACGTDDWYGKFLEKRKREKHSAYQNVIR